MKEIIVEFFREITHNIYLQMAVWNYILGYAMMYVHHRQEKKKWVACLKSLEKGYYYEKERADKLEHEA